MSWLDTQPEDKVAQALAKREGATDRAASYSGGDARFGLWLALVDSKVSRAVGLGLFDLGDCNLRDMYDDDMGPTAAAREALSQDDTYSALFGS